MKFRSPTTWSNQLCSLQLGAGHSSQIWSDVSFASPQNLQVDGNDPHHLYRWPSKTMWPVVAYMRVVNSFILIHLIILFWCVMGVAWFCIVEPCSTIAVFFCSAIFFFWFPFQSPGGQDAEVEQQLRFFAIQSTTLLFVTPECPQTQSSSLFFTWVLPTPTVF